LPAPVKSRERCGIIRLDAQEDNDMKKLDDMTPAEVRRSLQLLAVELGACHYRRRHPNAEPETAWEWGIANRKQFDEKAADVLALLLAVAEKEEGAGSFPPPSLTRRPAPSVPGEAG
jgi:hypothetical protein